MRPSLVNVLAMITFSTYKYLNVTKAFIPCVILTTATWNIVDAWKQCQIEEGGGICPVGNTCCLTGTPGISSCIPGREKDPEGARGQCCNPEGTTGCAYGYDCALKGGNVSEGTDGDENKQKQEICKLRDSHPRYLNAIETPRYKLCQLHSSSLSSGMLRLQRFPIGDFNAVYYSNLGSILPTDDKHNVNNIQKFSSIETVLVIVHGSGRNADDYLCAGISTASAISNRDNTDSSNSTELGNNGSISTDIDSRKVLVIAPKFVADVDHDDRSHYRNTLYWLEHGPDVSLGHTWRYGADAANANTLYNNSSEDDNGNGNDENQNGISSYAVMDRLLEFLITSKQQKVEERSIRQSLQQQQAFYFPNLKRIVVAGHSAGGQYVHRWALLSSSRLIWGEGNGFTDDNNNLHKHHKNVTKNRTIEIRTIVANPRSYCYLDNRRMIRNDKHISSKSYRPVNDTIGIDINAKYEIKSTLYTDMNMHTRDQYNYIFAVPDPRDVDICQTYNQWQWGLEAGGDVSSPYKDTVLNNIHNNLTALALRYFKRKVFYLVGEHDTIVQEDRCETYNFQGDNRNERGRRYFQALTEYLTRRGRDLGRSNITSSTSDYLNLIHEFHEVPGSPHDHTLMFQSAPAREALYGTEHESTMGMVKMRDHENENIVSFINSLVSNTNINLERT